MKFIIAYLLSCSLIFSASLGYVYRYQDKAPEFNYTDNSKIIIYSLSTYQKNGKILLLFKPLNNDYPKDYLYDTINKIDHEQFMEHLCNNNYKIILQFETGNYSFSELVKLADARFNNIKCLVGYGLDLEWYFHSHKNILGKKPTEAIIRYWLNLIQSLNPNYILMIKHFRNDYFSTKIKSDKLLYVFTSQQYQSFGDYIKAVNEWAKQVKTLKAIQYGYYRDEKWSDELQDPKLIIKLVLDNTVDYCIWVSEF